MDGRLERASESRREGLRLPGSAMTVVYFIFFRLEGE